MSFRPATLRLLPPSSSTSTVEQWAAGNDLRLNCGKCTDYRSSSSTHVDVVQQSGRHFLSESSTWQPLGVTLTVTNTLSVAEHVQAIIRACEVWTVHPCGASNSHGLKYAALQTAYRVNGQLSPDWLTQPALFISDEHLISDQISSLSNKTWLDYCNCLFG